MALDVSLDCVEKLVLVQEELEPWLLERRAKVRWMEAPAMHVGLKVLRRVDASLVANISDVVSGVTSNLVPFKVSVKGIHALPSADVPRLLMAHLELGQDLVEGLRQVIEAHLDRIGVQPDPRPYRPVIVLGRVLTPKCRVDVTDGIAQLRELDMGASYIRNVTLFGTVLRGRSPHTEVLRRFPLGRN